MPNLSGLEGTDGKERTCITTRTPNACIKALSLGYPASTADDNGSLTAWKRDDGKYGVSRDRFMSCKEAKTLGSLRAVRVWWKENLIKIT